MKAISNLEFEIKMPKLAKAKAAEVIDAHKHGKVYVLKEHPTNDRIEMGNIAGFVKSVIPLNNKAFVRVQFETRQDIKEANYQFVKLPFDGYVLVPV